MNKLSVAVIKGDFHEKHSSSWSREWLRSCEQEGIPHELVDWRHPDAMAKLVAHRVVLWHFSHYSSGEMAFATKMLYALERAGCLVFPSLADSIHFDDKVAQAFLLKTLGIATPRNDVLFDIPSVEIWLETNGNFPVVAKLKTGSGSNNVILLKAPAQLRRYAKISFARGRRSTPSLLLKARSNAGSSQSWRDFLARAKRAPEFLFSRRMAAMAPRERGYVYLQEFIPGVDHDLKVVVVGDRLSFIARRVRPGDFRASGGGDLFYDHSLISGPLIDAAFSAADAMKSDCSGLDMIHDPRTGCPVILEVSYGFSHSALLGAGGYYDRSHAWHPEPLNAPWAVLERLIQKGDSQ